MTDQPLQPPNTNKPPSRWLTPLAFLITLAGGFSYMLMLDIPWARDTGAPALAIMSVGCALALWLALRRRTRGTIATAGVNLLLTGLLVFELYGVHLPPPGATPAVGSVAPDFTLPDQDARPVTRSTAYAGGPVLLVFYRGHW